MPLAVRRLDTPRRSAQVFEELRSQILTRAIPPGGKLPNERDLAAAFGVNRGSVREAVKRLEALELVDVQHGQGTFARDAGESSALEIVEALLRDPRTVTVDLLRQILVFRRDVSTRVVELAVIHHRPEHVQRARILLDREVREGVAAEGALALDVEMNRLLGEASGNLLYQVVTNLFTKLIQRLGPIYYNDRRDHRRSHENHRALLAAMESGDVDEARRLLEVMLDYSERAILDEAVRLEATGVIGPRAGATP